MNLNVKNLNIKPANGTFADSRKAPAFSYRHIVSFEETNLVGNVYFTRHVAWQGRCREMFLKQHASGILDDLARDLRLVTLRVSCEYYEELAAFEEIEVQMRLAYLRQHRIGLDFIYLKLASTDQIRAALGFQEIGCMRATVNGLVPVQPPTVLMDALAPFGAATSPTPIETTACRPY